VRYRLLLFLLMTAAAVVSVFLIPHININSNMVVYLPDNSPMKQGLDILETQLPDIQDQMQEFGSVFADGNDLMPKGLPRTLAIGVGLLFLVLLVMSASVAEVALFLVTVGFAVVINMGTNALLPSVSMLTNTLSSVLQMVLSMDYSIILMNRYRQEKQKGELPVSAMETAVDGAASSILSSAFTTIVSLLMLCFIKMKIGADLGIVLAKGVTLSLICNFTVLPTLIIWADKVIDATRKKIPVLPSARLATFQHRFRIPIAILFLGVFVSFTLLQRRTQMCFAPQWESNVSDESTGENALMLLYNNADEMAVPRLLEQIGTDSLVHRCASYPSLVLQPRTIDELRSLAEGLSEDTAPELPEDLLRLVYYAQSHPQRTEELSLTELQSLAADLSARGMIPEGRFNPEQLMESLLPKAPQPAPKPKPAAKAEPAVIPDVEAEPQPLDTLIEEATVPPPIIADTLAVAGPSPAAPFTYEQATRPRTAAEMAAFTGKENGQVNTIYRLAGKRRGTMTPKEFVTYIKENILSKRIYAALVPEGTEEQLREFETILDAVIAAGPEAESSEEEISPLASPGRNDNMSETPDSTSVIPATPSAIPSAPSVISSEAEGGVGESPEPEAEPTPQEMLMEMALSGQRYPASRVFFVLSAAGLPVTREEIDLLYLYAGAQQGFDPETAIAPGTLLDYVADTLLTSPALAGMVPDSARTAVLEAREQLLSGVGMLHGPDYSAAAILSGYEAESDATFNFVSRVRALADEALQQPHYWIGESQMYKELKDGFPRELLLLTLLTVLSIFLIVALTFHSILVPIPLVMTIMAGVYVNVWASGLGGNSMYYLAYLIVQGILMGATIDYSILFTSYYLRARKENDIKGALEAAYRGSSHSILTSGIILSLVPGVMYYTMQDPVIALILRSLAIGAFAVLLIILCLLPGVLAALDPVLRKR